MERVDGRFDPGQEEKLQYCVTDGISRLFQARLPRVINSIFTYTVNKHISGGGKRPAPGR